MAVLGWAGREKVLIAGTSVLIGLPVAFFLILLFVQDLVTERGMRFLIAGGAWLPAIAILLVTFDVTVMAKRSGLLSQQSLYLILSLAIACPILVVMLFPFATPGKTLASLYSLAAVLPISAAPVMLYWNRNR